MTMYLFMIDETIRMYPFLVIRRMMYLFPVVERMIICLFLELHNMKSRFPLDYMAQVQ